jgi:hypothetical protein
MARRGSHWGSFGKGFMDAFLAAYRISMMQDLYANRDRHWRAQEDYWRSIGAAKGAKAQGLAEAERQGREDPNFHPDAGGGGGAEEGAYKGGAQAEAHAAEMSQYLQDNYGLSKAGAAAAVGNAWQENSFRTGIQATGDKDANGNFTSGGMFQWHGSRLADAQNWMRDNNKDPADWRSHMDYFVHDLQAHNQGLLNYLKTTDDTEGATHTIFKRYEIGDPKQAHMGNRVGMANAVFGGAAPTKTAKGKEAAPAAEPAAKVEKASDKTSQADTLPPSNQVASLDDDEAMRIALEQQNQARNPDQRNMDPATINEQAEQAGHYAFTHSGEPTPASPAGAGPAIPISPQAGPGGPNPNFQPNPPYVRPQQGPGGPDPNSAPNGPMQGPPISLMTPPIALGGGRGNELETPTGVVRALPAPIEPYEATRNIIPARPYTPTPTGGAAEVTRPVVGGDERLQPATEANAPAANAQPVSAVTPAGNQQAIPANPRFVEIAQPNIARTGNARGGQSGDSNAPRMGVPNLSWGPNPPLDQRTAQSSNIVLASSQGDRAGQTVPAPMPPSRPSDDAVGTPDMSSLDDTTFDVTAARKGGPMRPAIPRYAAGGNVIRFATGGGAPTPAQLADPGWQNTASTYTLPGNAPFTNQQVYNLQNTINSQPYPFLSPLAPSGSKDLTGFYGAYTPPAPAAAAAAPLNEPAPTVTPISTPTLTNVANNAATGGTTTGAYQLPDIVAPANNPTVNTPTTTFNRTPRTPSTLAPNAPGAGASDIGGTNFKQPGATDTGAYAGFKRGGAIPRYATGGDVTRFAAAGTVQPQAVQSALSAALYGPNAPYSQQQVNAGSPTMTVGQMQAANLAALTPEQQAWYNAQSAALKGYQGATSAAGASYTPPMGGFGGQAPAVNQGQLALAQNQQSYYQGLFDPNMPAAKAAAAAAAPAATTTAPAPAIPPTVTAISHPVLTTVNNDAATGGTTTGGYKLPDSVGPSPAPTTTVNPTPKIPTTTVPNTPNTGASDIGATDTSKKPNIGGDVSMNTGAYAGFRRGGITRRVTGYDDGGGVSPSFVGMPPGLSGGGAQPVPPIYYNNATFSPAGAAIGKGVTANSAPTYVAGAIPSLPMARGGVVGYDDGGDVQPDPNLNLDQGMDQVALNDDPRDAAIEQNIQAGDTTPAPQSADGMPAFTGYFSPTEGQDQAPMPTPAPAQGGGAQSGAQSGAQEDPHRPPGLLPYAAQGSDANGNPSNGFISALVGGIHWLADHLGVVGGAQAAGIAPDAQTQQNRQVYASRANMITKADREQLNNMADPHHTLDEFMRNINGMEQGYRWLLAQGDIVGANKMAASVLQYDVANANNYQEEAAKRYYDGDLPGAVKAINAAADAVPADQRFHAELAPDGKNLIITGSTLTGRQLWQQYAAPAAILSAVNKSLPWVALENQAAKYDPAFKDMAKARADAAKERYGDQQAAEAAQKFAPPRQAVTPQGNAPAAPAPAMPSVPTPPPTITADTTTTPPVSGGRAAVATPPPTADSNLAATGGDTGAALAALPSGPTRGPIGGAPDANAPAPNAAEAAQPVDFNQLAAALDHEESVSHQQVALEAQQRYQPQYEDYPDPALVRNKADLTAFNARKAEVAAHNAQVDKAKSEYLTGRQKDVSDRIAAQRARLQAQETETAANTRNERSIEAATTADTRKYKHEDYDINKRNELDTEQKMIASNLAGSAPRSDQEMNSMVGENKTFDPVVGIARAFNPSLPDTTPRAQAMNDMATRGFDANTQTVLAGAYYNGVRHSPNTTPDEVAAGIQSFVTGGHFIANAEQSDEKGNPIPLHGVVRYMVTVEDNTGNKLSFLMPANNLANLRNLRNQYFNQQAENTRTDVHKLGVLGALPGVTPRQTSRLGAGSEGGYAPTSAEEWQDRNPQQQTIQPPF